MVRGRAKEIDHALAGNHQMTGLRSLIGMARKAADGDPHLNHHINGIAESILEALKESSS